METNKLFAVFGNPILHSRSPQIHNSAFKELNIAGYYTRIIPRSAIDIIGLMRQLPIEGANITAPYKEEVFPLLDELSPDAAIIGAVNTIINLDGRLKGYNTDHTGVTNSLLEAGFQIHGKKCLVLGAGGATKAVAYALKNGGARVYICNRTQSRADAIAQDFGCETIAWNEIAEKENFDLVVSTLPNDVLPFFFDKLSCGLILDASYKPSLISASARNKGMQVIGGERWLLQQACEAFMLFSGRSVSIGILEEGFNSVLKKDDLKILFLEDNGIDRVFKERPDLVISGGRLSSTEKKQIVDEEIDKAFGG